MHTSKKALAEFAIAADCQKTQGRAREGRSFAAASGGNRRSGSPMRAKEAAQPVAAIAADEPSEAGSTASELANDAERPC